MKPKTAFVSFVLGLCGVQNVDDVSREQITSDIVRMMYNTMTPEAKDLLADMCGQADDCKEAVTIGIHDVNTPRLLKSGLLSATREEKILICRIYGANGREIEIVDDAIVVAPSNAVLAKIRKKPVIA